MTGGIKSPETTGDHRENLNILEKPAEPESGV